MWDPQDHLIVAEGGTRKLESGYDTQGRRIWKKSYGWVNNEWVLGEHLIFAYDGWNLLAEFKVIGGQQQLYRSYSWGESLGGGIGGLLSIIDHLATGGPKTYYPFYDGNGNVMGLSDSSGQVVATYQYDPFGKLIDASGPAAEVNPFRFSTKYYDADTQLYYYGYRYYSPALQRWMGRDPMEEEGGINLYAFVGNDPVNGFDAVGLSALPQSNPNPNSGFPRLYVPPPANFKLPSSVKGGGTFGSGEVAFMTFMALYEIEPVQDFIADHFGIHLTDTSRNRGVFRWVLEKKEKFDRSATLKFNAFTRWLEGGVNSLGDSLDRHRARREREELSELQNTLRASRQAAASRFVLDSLAKPNVYGPNWVEANEEVQATAKAIESGKAVYLGNGSLIWIEPDGYGSTMRWLEIEAVKSKREKGRGARPIDLYTLVFNLDEAATIREYARKTNIWILANGGSVYMKPTAGMLREQASAAADKERTRSEILGMPYGKLVAGHVPDATVTGLPIPPMGWMPMTSKVNGYIGAVEGWRIGRDPVNYFRVDGIKQ